jgi:hypothetical protein
LEREKEGILIFFWRDEKEEKNQIRAFAKEIEGGSIYLERSRVMFNLCSSLHLCKLVTMIMSG